MQNRRRIMVIALLLIATLALGPIGCGPEVVVAAGTVAAVAYAAEKIHNANEAAAKAEKARKEAACNYCPSPTYRPSY